MIPRYIASGDWIEEGRTARDIIIEDDEPRWSGLYDQEGRKLYRASERVPIGFQPHRSPR